MTGKKSDLKKKMYTEPNKMPKGKHQSSESKETMTKDVDNTQEKEMLEEPGAMGGKTPVKKEILKFRELCPEDSSSCIVMGEKVPKESNSLYNYLSNYGLNKTTSLNNMHKMNTDGTTLLKPLTQHSDKDSS